MPGGHGSLPSVCATRILPPISCNWLPCRLFGTLITPEENEARRVAARKEAEQRLKGE